LLFFNKKNTTFIWNGLDLNTLTHTSLGVLSPSIYFHKEIFSVFKSPNGTISTIILISRTIDIIKCKSHLMSHLMEVPPKRSLYIHERSHFTLYIHQNIYIYKIIMNMKERLSSCICLVVRCVLTISLVSR
jgi:hypothetical protein